MKVAVVGGGAAGYFAAVHVKENYPDAQVTIFEKSKKVLSKVKVSGGGRCNVTNGAEHISELATAYPRGQKVLKRLFHSFSNKDAYRWFEDRNVPLVTQEDNCVFPQSQDSQSIIDCLTGEAGRLGVKLITGCGVEQIAALEEGFELHFSKGETACFDKVIVTTGGSPKRKGLEWLEKLGHKIEAPVPSLFTFNMPNEEVRELMGIVVDPAQVSIPGTKLHADGPLLITHWGMSGPAILKLSAFGARELAERDYQFEVLVNWVDEKNQEVVSNYLNTIVKEHGQKLLSNYRPYDLPTRLWHFLLKKGGFPEDRRWNEIGKKGRNTLVRLLANDSYKASGKTTFKEEFVTCGGVSWKSINAKTLESKATPGLYFAGEVMDVDGITGGYNFQAAWTTGYIAGQLQ